MFSIIICSIHPVLLDQVRVNIEDTISQPYELLVWDNRDTRKGLCEVYNLLAAKARFPFICFMHEDILLPDLWGTTILDTFRQDSDLGMIGVSGSKYKSRTLSGTATGMLEFDRIEILHKNAKQETITLCNNPSRVVLENTVTLDGVFLATRKSVWQEFPFNEKALHGFHLYDLDFSIRVQQKFRIAVLFNFRLTHLTEGGSFGDHWVEDTIRWHRGHAKILPASVNMTQVEYRGLESEIRKKWLYRLRTENISFFNKLRWIYFSGALMDLRSWPYVGLFFFGKNYKNKPSKTKTN
jgi:Glycosyltransferase like family